MVEIVQSQEDLENVLEDDLLVEGTVLVKQTGRGTKFIY